ncbi:uncharacterized protein LOC114517069 [Dendronephthya gigantea]|uniref:uncharacterized protein LOC114517069 n=1 Tax=Dendronephthya gigantea TaxID=151771 RepID=UPI00106CE5D0|nr:uncharacterized protein LOC114517069 [Dendronephthya gigantea]
MDIRAEMTEYRSFMVGFANEFTDDDLRSIKYVLKDYIPAGKMEQLCTALQVFSRLEELGLLGPRNFDVFLDLVEAMHQPELLTMLKQFVVSSKVQRMREKIRHFKLRTVAAPYRQRE